MRRDENTIFYFDRGAYFAGNLEYIIKKTDDGLLFSSRSANDFYDMKDYQFYIPESALTGIELILSVIEDWDEKYTCPYKVFDGFGWDIYFDYEGIKVNSSGYEAFPPDFARIARLLQVEIEELCKEYADDYPADRIEERLNLGCAGAKFVC